MSFVARCLRCISLVVSLTLLTNSFAFGAHPTDAAQAKQMVEARGVGKGVRIHEVDGTVLRGKIVSIEEGSFGVQVGAKPSVTVPFAKVSQVQGPGLSKGEKIAIGVGVGVVVTAAIVIAVIASRGIGDIHFPSGISAIGAAGQR